MRVHVSLDDALVREIDQLAGPRGRNAYIESALRERVDRDRRWRRIEASFRAIEDGGREWDANLAAWVRAQRRDGERPVD
jgi:predicted transcriptional regulator